MKFKYLRLQPGHILYTKIYGIITDETEIMWKKEITSPYLLYIYITISNTEVNEL